MDSWNAAQNWAIFIPVAAGLTAYYYWPRENKQTQSGKARPQATPAATPAPKPAKSSATKSPKKNSAVKAKTPPPATENVKQGEPKRKVERKEPAEESEEEDAKEFARRMTQAMQGVDVKKPDAKATRVKTVKQSNAVVNGSNGSFSAPGAETEESHDGAARDAGSVADMLEPAAAGPSTLRILASDKPAKVKPQKSAKEVKQSKKARQNEKKKEEQRLQREEDEKQRKALEEKQRRTAREARGEPAKNGLSSARAPVDSAWNGQPAASAPQASQSHAPLLDTFDEESTSSSNAGASTAATSTADGDDVARAVKESLNDSAWTTAGTKKNKKKMKPAANEGEVTPTPVKAPPPPVVKKVQPNGKPLGFQALTDEYEQRTDVDANDASNWDA